MYSIGAFSRLSHISARMLRHYDALGLLRPAHVDESTLYRYYDEAQLSSLMQIETLKGYGFSLAQVRELLALPPEALSRRIQERRVEAYRELEKLRESLRRMEEDILRMEGTGMLKADYHVILMEAPALRVLGLRKTISISQTHALFQALYREVERRGLKRAGASQLLFLGEDFNYESMDVEAQVVVAGSHPDVKEFPAGQFAAVTHMGPYETIRYAYDALCAWLGEHPEYEVCGPSVERYLKDEGEAGSPEALETGVLFPVRRVE